MADWGYALGKGLAAAAQSGVESIETGQKLAATEAAEQRAANRQLDTAQRLMAIQEAMKTRAAERFSTVVKGKMAGAPLAIAPGDPAPQDNAGMVVKPTIQEASQAALDETLTSDPGAYLAGTGMLAAGSKVGLEDRKLEQREKLAAAERERKEKHDETEGERKERIANAQIDQRERAADRRFALMLKKIDGGAGGKGSKSAMVQNLEWMRDNLHFTPDQLADYVTEKKHSSPEDIAAKLLSADKFGELTPETAMERAQELVKARDKVSASGKGPAGGPGKTVPNPFDSPKRLKYNPKTGKFD